MICDQEARSISSWVEGGHAAIACAKTCVVSGCARTAILAVVVLVVERILTTHINPRVQR